MNATDKAKGAVGAILAISEAIRELGQVPSGTLYAQLCGKMTLEQYNAVIQPN